AYKAPKIAPNSHLTGPVKPANTTKEIPLPIVQPIGPNTVCAKNENVGNTLGENAFPPKQQLGLKLSFIKGAAGKPVTLKAAA
ncbi:hypothetical protein D3H45_10615, partial [Streptococcus pyogenes]